MMKNGALSLLVALAAFSMRLAAVEEETKEVELEVRGMT
jgi:hypothetical protein